MYAITEHGDDSNQGIVFELDMLIELPKSTLFLHPVIGYRNSIKNDVRDHYCVAVIYHHQEFAEHILESLHYMWVGERIVYTSVF